MNARVHETCTAEQFSGVKSTSEEVKLYPVEYLTALQKLNEKNDIAKQRQQAFNVLLRLYAGGVIANFVIIFLQGFHFAGFALDKDLMSWLGPAVIGELAGLLAIALSFIFKNKD